VVRQADPRLSLASLRAKFDWPGPYWDGLRKLGLPEG
jgi:hypothetical protein